ncbi:hypothetical protein FRACYDRAFT_232677 [Fragilariopsis cylindrus CCMP1102]|uniref:RING-type domain-containing protein n=1 Tax=Fragilariopsis cylindrus CCMP1102 TaxID=635003 RepID=A0A1E7FWH8_9STRA|nr:hypothetical protein FRACYDRAFT_232677 [Fragilariopsis cylindrus CCMP1102]|eukprot:OEU22518.1 hypothetical protein FRACYDRAFT_232677 [Fragilariopsis cylindrus CCMP1102]
MSFNSDANTTNLADSLLEQSGDYNFEPKIFWSVNAFIFVMICISAVFCCFGQRYFSHEGNRLNQSDQNILRQLRRRQEADRTEVEDENLEGRKRKLLAGFAKHKVEMTVKEEDLILMEKKDIEDDDNDNISTGIESERNQVRVANDGEEMEDDGQLKLHDGDERLVPNCCAVCLSGYKVDDHVVWSSNPDCAHAFHRDCVLGWLIKMQSEAPCPCCRQEFTDLENIRKERKIKWIGPAFDFNAIRL